jgi:branched-chain amino acid transport system ATP-binding protein
MPTSASALTIDSLSVRYGPITAVSEVTLEVHAGEIVALLGANGAGKSSLLRAVSGLVRPASGTVRLGDVELNRRKPHQITRAGVIHVPEGRRVISPLSVEENLKVAALASGRRLAAEVPSGLDEVYALFPRLMERRLQTSGLLSGGEQQMLAIGRALMAKPAILLLDEPSMGLAPIVIDEIYGLLKLRSGASAEAGILLAEQSAATALTVADRALLFARGSVTFEGTPAALLADKALVSSYFGSKIAGDGLAPPPAIP